MTRSRFLGLSVLLFLAGLIYFFSKPREEDLALKAPSVPSAAPKPSKPTNTLLFFTAPWCGPCAHLKATTLKDPAVQVELGKVTFRTYSEDRVINRKYNVSGYPTLVYLRGDTEAGRKVGYLTATELVSWFVSLSASSEVVPP